MAAKKSGPPKAGTSITVRVDDIFAEDLAVMFQAGKNTTDAVRDAVNHLARCVSEAWRRGKVPEGEWPEMTTWVSAPKAKPQAEQDIPRAA